MPLIGCRQAKAPSLRCIGKSFRNTFLNGDHGLSEDDFEAYNMETVALADRIVDLPARNADDMLRKIMGYTINGDHDLSEGDRAQRIFAEARALLGVPA